MITVNQKKQNDNKNKIGTIAAGVAGAVVIAGVAVAATMALEDEKTRKKIKNTLVDVKDRVIDYVDTFKTESYAKKGTKTINKILKNTKKVFEKEI